MDLRGATLAPSMFRVTTAYKSHYLTDMIKAKHALTGQIREFGDVQWQALPTIKNGALAGTKAGYKTLDATDEGATVAKTFTPPELTRKAAPSSENHSSEEDVTGNPPAETPAEETTPAAAPVDKPKPTAKPAAKPVAKKK